MAELPEGHALFHAATKRELRDARGISCGYVCDQCERQVRGRYRAEIFSDACYPTDETIEGDDWFEEGR
jgi:hypothetical protein